MTPASRRSLPVFGGLLLVGWGAFFLTRPTASAGSPALGVFAPYDSALAGSWTPVATLRDAALDAGAIVALDARDDTLVLSHRRRISLFVGGTLRRQFGDDTPGAPTAIGRGEGIALTDAGIAQLDARLHRVRFWSPEGTPRHDVALPAGDVGAQYGPATADAAGLLVPSFQQEESSSAWMILRVTPSGVETLVADHARDLPGNAYHVPLVAPTPTGLVTLDAMDATIRHRSADGAALDSFARPDPPRFAIPDRSRRRLRELSATMPEALRRSIAIDAWAPSARALGVSADGQLLVLSADLEDATHVELLALDGRPLARLWSEPIADEVFVVRGALYRVRERDAEHVVERLTLNPARP